MIRAIVLLAAVSASAAAAEDFSAGSEAESWGLAAEQPARFEAKVVDILCELSGDCPTDCGGGARQIGLLRHADGQLIYPNKNGAPLFNGAAQELLPFCGAEVEVDGLMLQDDEIGLRNVYQLQKIRRTGEADWTPATRWTEVWAAKYPEAAAQGGDWFRNDPRVNAAIAKDGWFGLGLERDQEILETLK